MVIKKNYNLTNLRVGCSDFEYANGNMTSDKNKAISTIAYNHLNLPDFIVFANGNVIEYLYTSTGQKVQKTVREDTANPPVLKTVDYLDGFQYAGEVLQFFPHPEGYVNATPYAASLGALPTSYAYNYVFNYTDHLGNVRLSYSKDLASGQLKVLEENHYYPFGLKHKVYNTGKMDFEKSEQLGIPPVINNVTKTKYDYKFQSQERQDELGLNWDSFKWRNYDYAIGRFMSIDPLAEQYSYQSPYNFAENRVVDGRELEGLEWVRSTTANANGTNTHTISANIKVLNNAQDNISNANLEKHYLGRFTEQMENSFNGSMTNGDQVVVGEVNYEMVTSVDEGDFYMEITNQVVDASGNSVDGVGKVDTIGNTQENRIQVEARGTEMTQTVVHENAHTMGLRHPSDPQNPIKNEVNNQSNLMSTNSGNGTQVVPEQRDIMIDNIPLSQ